MNKQNFWIDRMIAMCGIILAAVPIADWAGIFSDRNFGLVLNAACMVVGIMLIVVVTFRLRTKTYEVKTKLKHQDFYAALKGFTTENTKVVICGPDSTPSGKEFIEYCCDRNIGISILGSSRQINMLIASLEHIHSLTNKLNITRFSNDFTLVAIYDEQHHRVVIGGISEDDGMFIRFTGKTIASEVSKLVESEILCNSNPIQLSRIAHPRAFLNIVDQTNQRFLENFIDLKSGFISFHGTEVLNAQSGWMESGQFCKIRTLDLTTNPGLLLSRERYLQANKTFISQRGIIERVFLVERSRLADDAFRDGLQTVALHQIEMGIDVDIQLVDNLKPEQKQDFILYDNFAVLIEEKQANSDYSFGKSTAYFGQDKIAVYEAIFESVWHGGRSKDEILNFFDHVRHV